MTDRSQALARTFAAAFAALAEHAKTQPAEAETLMASVASHVRSTSPLALAEPVREVERDLADGSRYRLSHEAGCATLVLTDHEETTAVSTLTPVEAIRFRADVAAVAAGKENAR